MTEKIFNKHIQVSTRNAFNCPVCMKQIMPSTEEYDCVANFTYCDHVVFLYKDDVMIYVSKILIDDFEKKGMGLGPGVIDKDYEKNRNFGWEPFELLDTLDIQGLQLYEIKNDAHDCNTFSIGIAL